MVKTMRKKRKRGCRKAFSLPFFDELAKQRYYPALYHPNHIETQERDFFWQKKRCGKASRSGKRRMAFRKSAVFLQQADRWDDVPCLRRISKQWLRYSLKAAAYGNNNVAECSRNYRYSYIHTKKWSHSQRKRAHPQ